MGSAKQTTTPIKSQAELISGTGLFVNLKPKENKATKELRDSIIKIPKEKRPLTQLLSEYEKRRILFDKIRLNDLATGGEPLMFESIAKAIRRMSHDYQITEENLRKKHSANEQIKLNIQKYQLNQINDQITSPKNKDFSDAVSHLTKPVENPDEIYTI